MDLFSLPSIFVYATSHGLNFDQLFRVVERAFAWSVIRRLTYSLPIGIAVLGLVVMFGWKWYRQYYRRATKKVGRR